MQRYGWSFRKSLHVNFWWWLEQLGDPPRGGDGGLWGYVTRFAYRHRKAAERA